MEKNRDIRCCRRVYFLISILCRLSLKIYSLTNLPSIILPGSLILHDGQRPLVKENDVFSLDFLVRRAHAASLNKPEGGRSRLVRAPRRPSARRRRASSRIATLPRVRVRWGVRSVERERVGRTIERLCSSAQL